MTNSELRIERCRREDLEAVAALHVRAFPDSGLTAFGTEAVRRYYLWLLEGPHAAELMLARQGARVVGFCASGWFRGAMRGFLRANRLYLATQLIKHPSLLGTDLVRDRIELALRLTWRFSRFGSAFIQNPRVPQDVRRFGVLAIATDPDVRGSGAGRALMLESEARARREGYSAMSLTVHPANARGVQFYEQLGWERRIVNGAWTGNMERPLR